MNDAIIGAFGSVLIAAGAVVLVVAGLSGMEVGVSVIGAALFVGGCLLRIEAAILYGKPDRPNDRHRDQ